MDSQKKKKKKKTQYRQISTSETLNQYIRNLKSIHQKSLKAKANLKTKQQSNASPQKLDWSNRSLDSKAHRRPSLEIGLVTVQRTLSLIRDCSHIFEDRSSPEHIVAGSLVIVARPSSQIANCLAPRLLRCSMLDASSLKVFLSLFLSDSLSISH